MEICLTEPHLKNTLAIEQQQQQQKKIGWKKRGT